MKILSITPFQSETVETDDCDWPTHRRHGPDAWEQLMGQSWESVGICDGLEAAYQLFKYGPRYTHDCDSCTCLGQLGNHDLYYCDQSGRPTVIARWGDDGPQYVSGTELAPVYKPPACARELALAAGLLDP